MKYSRPERRIVPVCTGPWSSGVPRTDRQLRCGQRPTPTLTVIQLSADLRKHRVENRHIELGLVQRSNVSSQMLGLQIPVARCRPFRQSSSWFRSLSIVVGGGAVVRDQPEPSSQLAAAQPQPSSQLAAAQPQPSFLQQHSSSSSQPQPASALSVGGAAPPGLLLLLRPFPSLLLTLRLRAR